MRSPGKDAAHAPGASNGSGNDQRMLARVRQARIADTVRVAGSVTVTEIAEQLAVSEMTVRRDLVELERAGLLVRTHGGALMPQSVAEVTNREEPAFEARLREHRVAKERIAAAAASLVQNARTVALDVGATTYLIAIRLLDKPNIKIFTNSLRIASLLGDASGEVYVPGGQVRGDELSIGGANAVAQFQELWFDIAFVGVSGVTSSGFFDYSFEERELKRVYLRRSDRKVVVCDDSKFQKMSLVQVAELSEVDMLITNAPPGAELAAALAAANVQVIIAPPEIR